MSKNIYIEGTSVPEFLKMLETCVQEATSDLRQEVDSLKEEIRKGNRRTVSHRAAPLYFDGSITPERVLDYIHGRRLPEGAPGPLPAYKNGNTWFIEVKDIESWQLGIIDQ